MTPHRFRQVRQLYRQSQAEWAATLGYAGDHGNMSIYRFEAGRKKIPGPTAKLVELLERVHVEDIRERLTLEDWLDLTRGRIVWLKPKENADGKEDRREGR